MSKIAGGPFSRLFRLATKIEADEIRATLLSFVFIASGASIGTIAGSTATLFLASKPGTLNLMLLAATILVLTVPLIAIPRSSVSSDAAGSNQDSSISGNPFAGIRQFISNPYLLGIALFIFLYTSKYSGLPRDV